MVKLHISRKYLEPTKGFTGEGYGCELYFDKTKKVLRICTEKNDKGVIKVVDKEFYTVKDAYQYADKHWSMIIEKKYKSFRTIGEPSTAGVISKETKEYLKKYGLK